VAAGRLSIVIAASRNFLGSGAELEEVLHSAGRSGQIGRGSVGSKSATERGGSTSSPVKSRNFDAVVGESQAIRATKSLLGQIAASPATTVLLVGESGTGKGLIARELHEASRRGSRRFETICCSALPESLLESELFGYEEGAFTGARKRKQGLLELADGGTAFLDEIGETSLKLQVKLLGFLEERTFKRVGGTADLRVDVRVIAATNRDLERAVRDGAFRADLYYRLNVLPVRVPPLRERLDDIPLLVRHFVALFNRQLGRSVESVAPKALERLQTYGWPGNIRELRNLVERAMLLAARDELRSADLKVQPASAAGTLGVTAFELPADGIDLAVLERDLIAQALERTAGNRTRAAKLLGLTRHQINYRIEKLELNFGDR
jgi:transcriptional regulator with PAS, ATPase and Fis domain